MSTLRRLLFHSLWIVVVHIFVVGSEADECGKAREAYRKGVTLLRFEERRDAFLDAVVLCPSFAEAHVNLADAYENLHEFQRAEDHYLKAIALDNTSFIPYLGLGEVYLKTGRFSISRDVFERAKKLNPGNRRLLAGLKTVSERLGREHSLTKASEITSCLVDDEEFRLMCMCPKDYSDYLRRWICLPPITFDVGSSWLGSDAEKQLNEIAKALTSGKLTGRRWYVIGHADAHGRSKDNLKLSKQRALRVKAYLVKRGMKPQSLTLKFFGHTFRRAENTTAEGRTENRRVEIVPVQ